MQPVGQILKPNLVGQILNQFGLVEVILDWGQCLIAFFYFFWDGDLVSGLQMGPQGPCQWCWV